MKRLLFFLLIIMLISLSHNGEAALNRALKLDGDPDSAMEAPDHPSLDANLDKMTVEAWVNPDNDAGERMIVNKEDVYEMALVDSIFKTAIQPAGQGWDWISSDDKAPAGKWTHVAITYDGEKTSLYINGEFMADSEGWQGKLNDSPDTFKVGRRTRGGDTHSAYSGLIDEVRVSNAIRYDKDFEVQKGAFEPDGDTVALYHFDAEVGGKIEDYSKYGNDGKLVKKAELEEITLPNTLLAVYPKNKLAAIWGKIKKVQ
ncbi:LamG domain-containing protein [bacterium]|nr:LamG domain-containing protein [bacterium]